MKKILKRTAIAMKKSLSIVLAFSMMISVCIISGFSVGAASSTTNGQTIYINLSQNSTWNAKSSFTVRFANASGTILKTSTGVTNNNGVLTVTAPSGATKVEISAAPFTLPSTAVANEMHRIFLNASSVNGTAYSNPYIHYYSGDSSHGSTTWPGNAMTRLGSTNYYYYDIHESYTKLNFSNNGSPQTSDLPINFSYSDEVGYYNGSNWQNPYIKYIDLTDIPTTATEYYLLSDGTFEKSKYISTLADQTTNTAVTFKTVYVYGENWTGLDQIYVSYDYSDQYKSTIKLEKETINSKVFFKGVVPEGASIRFQPNQNNTTGASPATQYPTTLSGVDSTGYTDNTATFKYSKTGAYTWCKFSDIENVNYDNVVPNTFSNNSNILGVDATYFDYISDNEHDNGYLENASLGYSSWDQGNGTWFPFTDFNKWISNLAATTSYKSWDYPLYFGNLYNVDNQYGYSTEVSGLTRYSSTDYAVNNSNGLNNFNQSIQGLAYSTLDSDGDIQVANGVKMPYFDEDKLLKATITGESGTNRIAQIYKSYFPFRATTSSSGVTTYTFDSTNATDNVYFTWDDVTPKYVNYGAGTTYGVSDAAQVFGNSSNGYGIFPFNNTSSTKKVTVNDSSITVPTIGSDEFLIYTSKSTLYLYLWKGESHTEVTLNTKESRGGRNYFVVDSSVYGNYTNCIFKPYSGDNWTDKTADLTISDLTGSIWNSDGSKHTFSATTTYERGGNDNLDFGFGIRLDIDFRVPDYGTVDGTSSGEAVKFEYSGDDDLWVFIGEDETGANSELVLDLGGDHKQAEGNINFKTMTATVNDSYKNLGSDTYTSGTTIPDNEIWIKTGNYADFCLHVWQDTSVATLNDGAYFIKPYATSGGYYKFKSTQFGSNTAVDFCQYMNTSGKLYYASSLSSLYGKSWNGDGSSDSSASSTLTKVFGQNLSSVKSRSTSVKTLDPNTTYHMTVFYMERGLAESNFSVGFTMTPANNDLQVEKTLDTGNVVPAMAADLKANESFSYSINDGSGNTSGKSYTLTDADGKASSSTIASSSFALKDSYVADFNNTFKTESQMTVTETFSNNALSYDTSWKLSNNKIGSLMKSSDSSNPTTSSFKLVDPNDSSSYASLKLDYTNTIKTNTLSVSKEVFDEDGETEYDTNQQFTFKLSVDLDGENGTTYDYKSYPFEYKLKGDDTTIYKTTENGEFAISPDEEVEIMGLPVGATYKLEEYTAVGYKPYKVTVNGTEDTDFDGTVTGTVGSSSTNTVVVGNSIDPVKTQVKINKTLDGKNYSGSQFTYTITGFGPMDLPDGTTDPVGKTETMSTSGKTQTVTTPNSSGEVIFDSANVLSFVGSGYYRFIIREALASGVNSADYTMEGYAILVQIEVDASGNVKDPTYYKVKESDLANAKEDADYATFFNSSSNFSTTVQTLKNTTTRGKVTVNKTDQSGADVADTKFALIRVAEADSIDKTELQAIINANENIITSTTDKDGVATFEKLIIFKTGGEFDASGKWTTTDVDNYITGKATYQTYCLFEYSPATGYNPTYQMHYFTLPVEGKYEVTYEYQDGAIVMPHASGEGTNNFLFIGLGIIGTGAVLFASYTAYDRVQRRKRKARHTATRH